MSKDQTTCPNKRTLYWCRWEWEKGGKWSNWKKMSMNQLSNLTTKLRNDGRGMQWRDGSGVMHTVGR